MSDLDELGPSLQSLHISEHKINRIVGNVFACGNSYVVERLPDVHDDFFTVLEGDGVPLVAKDASLDRFARLVDQGYPVLFRRPPTWGLDFFISMVAARLDLKYKELDPFAPFRAATPPSKWSRHNLHRYHILHLDLGSMNNPTNLIPDLEAYFHQQCMALIAQYQLNMHFPPPKCVRCGIPYMTITCFAMYLRDHRIMAPLLVIISNFDAPIWSLGNCGPILDSLFNGLESATEREVIGGLLLFSDFNDGTLFPCLKRRPDEPFPDSPKRHLVNLKCTLDVTYHPAFQTAVGFSRQDIADLDEAFKSKGKLRLQTLLQAVDAKTLPANFNGPWDTNNSSLLELAMESDTMDVAMYPTRLVFNLVANYIL
ncbi:hypothetical protein MIND_00847300 [Mycena indigotica]|uniref:Uncharacterized protein n=1 Tax=Mycena indigotica TaxID=2126181 RepID=A0A8H6SHX6_9AGAR|nr:uncharacterized protein MIND_00847300 [Mycena indigotica]KAF7298991.1 hypothetical protein MIND_00847300 [Mycena indigotica]